MRTAILALGVGVAAAAAIMGGPAMQQPVQLAPKLEPVVAEPLPPLEAVPLPTPRPKAVEKEINPQAKNIKRLGQKETAKEITPKVPDISCAEARRGVGMPCFAIRQHSWRYDQLSPKQKAHADGCLTAAERATIKACFQ